MPWGAAIGAVGSLGAAAINSSGNTRGQTTTTQSSPQTVAASNFALNQAQNIAQRPFTPYTGQVVANMAPNQQQAVSTAQSSAGQGQNLVNQGASKLSNLPTYSSSALQPYVDPYAQAVLNPQLRQENLAFQQEKESLLNSKAGAFGGDRSALQETGLERTHLQNVTDLTGKTMSDAFRNAQQAFFQDSNRQIAASQALTQAGGEVSKLNTQDIQNLMATGGLQQVLQQSQLDFNYNQFLQAQNWSISNLQPLLDTIGVANGVSRTSTIYNPRSSVAGQVLGAASAITGAYFTGKNQDGTDLGNLYSSGAGSFLTDQAVNEAVGDPGTIDLTNSNLSALGGGH